MFRNAMGNARELGRYEVIRQIGEGGMAVVHLARQRDLNRLVALKELSALRAEDPSWASRFVRESQLAGSLTHANVVTVHDYFEHDGLPYIAMEYLERGSLRPFVSGLDLPQLGSVIADVLAGLNYAGKRGIVHRDLKPENLLLTTDGAVKIADFGIAKATSNLGLASFNTGKHVAVGTPAYMAPEQSMGGEIGPWSDLYALGCMVYEMCVGRLPFTANEPMALMLHHITEPVVPACTANPSVEPELSAWIDGLLVKDPSARTPNAAEAWESFEEILINRLGARWRRSATIPAAKTLAPPPRALTSSLYVSVAFDADGEVLLTPTAVATPPGMSAAGAPPGPFTPAPLSAIVDPEIAGLDPSPLALPGRRSLGLRRLIIGGSALAAAGVAVVLLTAGDDPPADQADQAGRGPVPIATVKQVAATLHAGTGPLSVQLPAGWSTRSGVDGPAGLALEDALEATPSTGSGRIVLGLAPTSSTTHALLPAKLLDDGRTPDRTVVEVGRARAYRYGDLADGLVVYAVPTASGVATIACEPPVGRPCDQVAASLKIDGVETYPLGPDTHFADAVAKAIKDVNRATDDGRHTIANAGTPARQANAAGTVRAHLAHVATRLRRLRVSPADNALKMTLSGAITAEATAFDRLRSAADHRDRTRYARAASAARDAQHDLLDGLEAFEPAGYRHVQLVRAVSVPALKRTPTKRSVSTPSTQSTETTPQPTPTYQQRQQTATVTPKVNKPKPTPIPSKPTPIPLDDG
jgi:hypothetical protein